MLSPQVVVVVGGGGRKGTHQYRWVGTVRKRWTGAALCTPQRSRIVAQISRSFESAIGA